MDAAGPSRLRVIRFGHFWVDQRAREVRKEGVKVRLQEQPFHLLSMLLEHPGEIVTREQLQKKIWPADTFVDFDQGLNNAVKRLREALRDSAEDPRFIETIPRRGYRFIGKVTEKTAEQIRSLAVLPLENLSHDPEQEYFAEGMTEALITNLAKIGGLRVISRTSAMQYKGVYKPLREIARELDVDTIVEGTVLRVGRRVRITAQLIDAPNEAHLWAESYEHDLRNVLALQSEVAQAIAREVQIKLTPQEQAQFAQAPPVDPESYEAYLKGRYHWNRRVVGGFEKAIAYFQEAIAKDPTYGAAYAGLADCLSGLGVWGFVPPNEGCGKAKRLALKALEIDRGLAEGHASLAWATMWYDYDFLAAEREFERSIELNPRYATARQWFGMSLGLMGRYEEGYAELKRAVRLDPCSSVIPWTLGFVYRRARRCDQAIEQHERALELDPNFAQGHGGLGFDYLEKCMYEPAIAELQKAVQLSQSAPTFVAWLGEAYAAAGHRDEALKILERLQELAKQRYVTPYIVAGIYAALGKKEEALRRLDSAYVEHAAFMVLLKTDPRFDHLRSDPHFQDLLRRMNFPE
jgi:TolB-like protein/Tfp pilus assembly protein PilF